MKKILFIILLTINLFSESLLITNSNLEESYYIKQLRDELRIAEKKYQKNYSLASGFTTVGIFTGLISLFSVINIPNIDKDYDKLSTIAWSFGITSAFFLTLPLGYTPSQRKSEKDDIVIAKRKIKVALEEEKQKNKLSDVIVSEININTNQDILENNYDTKNTKYAVSLIETKLISEYGDVMITWMDIEDFSAKYKIYRYYQIINSLEVIKNATCLGVISSRIQQYKDTLPTFGKYYYAVVTEIDGIEKIALVYEQSYNSTPIYFGLSDSTDFSSNEDEENLKKIINKYNKLYYLTNQNGERNKVYDDIYLGVNSYYDNSKIINYREYNVKYNYWSNFVLYEVEFYSKELTADYYDTYIKKNWEELYYILNKRYTNKTAILSENFIPHYQIDNNFITFSTIWEENNKIIKLGVGENNCKYYVYLSISDKNILDIIDKQEKENEKLRINEAIEKF